MSRILFKYENQITQKYKKNLHKGIDIVGYKSQIDNIIAHSAGKVVWINEYNKNNILVTGNNSYGNAIKILHDNGMYTLYAHLSKVDVKLNDNVLKGQIIGCMGNTGRSFGAHLHFEVRDNKNNRLDPTNYINADLPSLKTETKKLYIEVIAKSGLWARGGVGYKYPKLKLLKYGTKAELIEYFVASSNGYNWAHIKYNNQHLYVPNKWIKYHE